MFGIGRAFSMDKLGREWTKIDISRAVELQGWLLRS